MMRWRRRNMLKITGLSGWMRANTSSGWGGLQSTTLPPMVNWMLSTGQMQESQKELIKQFYAPYPSLAYRYNTVSNMSANNLPIVPQLKGMAPFPVMTPLAVPPSNVTPAKELDYLRKEKESLLEELNIVERKLKELTKDE